MDESDEQLQNARLPIHESLESDLNVIDEGDLHPVKQKERILSTQEGIQIDESDEQLFNTRKLRTTFEDHTRNCSTVTKTTTTQFANTSPNYNFTCLSKIPDYRNTFKIHNEISTHSEAPIPFFNTNLTQIRSSQCARTQFSKSERKAN
jgi:hypothetical protein